MDEQLKEAIEMVRRGDKQTAQRQLTQLLDKNPEQVQGWYLLSLLVDSPQKQAAYLSKTLALNPHHEKASEQLAALRDSGSLAPTTQANEPLDVIAQSDTAGLPDWLQEATGESPVTAVKIAQEQDVETAVPNTTLPDWLKEPAALDPQPAAPAEVTQGDATLIGQTTKRATDSEKIKKTAKQTGAKPKPAKAKTRPTQKSTRNLNMALGLLVTLAIIVIMVLVYLLLS